MLVALLGFGQASDAVVAPSAVELPPHMRPAVAALLDGFAPDAEHRFQLDRMDHYSVQFRLVRASLDGGEEVVGGLRLHHRGLAEVGGSASKSFMMRSSPSDDASVRAAIAVGMQHVVTNDRGGYYTPVIRAPTDEDASSRQLYGEAITLWLPLLLALLLFGAIVFQVRRAR